MALNGVLAPRKRGCWVCEKTGAPDHVTMLLFNEDGTRKTGHEAYREARIYLRSMHGKSVTEECERRRLVHHADHVWASMNGLTVARVDMLVPVAPEGPRHWLDVNQNAVNIGNEALAVIQTHLPDMEDRELVAVAKLGVAAAQKVGDWEAKGRKLAQIDDLIRLASGMEVEGEAVVVE